MFRITLAVFAGLLTSAVQAEEIPLKSVWATSTPGTKELRELDSTMVETARKAVDQRDKAGKAFAVAGTGLDALRSLYNILTKQKSVGTLPSGEVSIAFFTKRTRRYIYLSRVVVGRGTIQIVYQQIPHHEEAMTQHLAVIPVGKLTPGNYTVSIVAEPLPPKMVEEGFTDGGSNRIVSSSFKFQVE